METGFLEIGIFIFAFLLVFIVFLCNFLFRGEKGNTGEQGPTGYFGTNLITNSEFFKQEYQNVLIDNNEITINFFSNNLITIDPSSTSGKIIMGEGLNVGTFFYIDTTNLNPQSSILLTSICKNGIGDYGTEQEPGSCGPLDSLYIFLNSNLEIEGFNIILKSNLFYYFIVNISVQGKVINYFTFNSI